MSNLDLLDKLSNYESNVVLTREEAQIVLSWVTKINLPKKSPNNNDRLRRMSQKKVPRVSPRNSKLAIRISDNYALAVADQNNKQ